MKRTAVLLSSLLALSPLSASAQDAAKMGELERKLDVLTQEIEKLKLGSSVVEPVAEKGVLGLAPAASKVYKAATNKVSIGGYGEMIYQNFSSRRQNASSSGTRNEADFLRAILYAGYKFNDWMLFNSEIEFEHATTKVNGGVARGEVSVELAYVDFQLSQPLSARAGILLMPVGLTNEVHEPTTFHGVKRPSVESSLIPTTWRENGAGVYGSLGPVSYRSYVVTGLQAVSNTGVTGFSSSSGLRNGRSSGAKSFAEDLASVTRVDYEPVPGTLVGGSFYVGEADHDFTAASIPVTLWEAHGRAAWRGAEFKALYTEVRVGNADRANVAQGVAAGAANTSSIGRKMFGGYVEGAYDVLSLMANNKGHSLSPFVRYERYDTQADTPELWGKNPANSRVEYTAGLTYKPIPQVALKADHQWMLNQARTGVNQWNLGIGYIF
jgi:hypothetical protein